MSNHASTLNCETTSRLFEADTLQYLETDANFDALKNQRRNEKPQFLENDTPYYDARSRELALADRYAALEHDLTMTYQAHPCIR
jgi:hypothetical protein